MSRKLTSAFFVSLDGVVESPQDWHFPYFNDEMGAVIGASMAAADTMLLGRVGYEEWAEAWADSDSEMGTYINNVPKYVASTTLDEVGWQNSHLLEGDVAKAVAELKRQPGANIAMSGSATLVRSLLDAGLVDELHLMIHPVVVGKGARLFPEGESNANGLELVDSTTFGSGVVYAVYAPASGENGGGS